jgi:predicted transcriptional regulator
MTSPPRAFLKAFPILNHLAVNPRATPYAIEKKVELDRPTVHAAMRALANARLVKVIERKKLPTGLVRKKYVVTPQGIVALLQAHPDYITLSKDDIRKLAEKQAKFLPLIFGKWKYFRERNVEDLAYHFLLLSVKRTGDQVGSLLAAARSGKAESSFEARLAKLSPAASLRLPESMFRLQESAHRHDIYAGVLVRPWTFNNKDARLWAETIRGDRDLFEMAEKEVSRLRGESQEDVDFWNWCSRILRGEDRRRLVELSEDSPRAEAAWELLHEMWHYQRAKALDDGKPPLTFEGLLRKSLTHFYRKRTHSE